MTKFGDSDDQKNADELMTELVDFQQKAEEIQSASIFFTGTGKGTSSQKRSNLLRAIDYTKLSLDKMRKLAVKINLLDD